MDGPRISPPSERWAPLVRPGRLDGRTLDRLLALLTGLDCDFLRQNPRIPPLYRAGVRYRVEAKGQEQWLTIPHVLLRGHGDCEDLACWRAAELIVRGEPAKPIWSVRRTPRGRLYHIRVRRANGAIEDPSFELGMKVSLL